MGIGKTGFVVERKFKLTVVKKIQILVLFIKIILNELGIFQDIKPDFPVNIRVFWLTGFAIFNKNRNLPVIWRNL